jgi:hypothetical protein
MQLHGFQSNPYAIGLGMFGYFPFGWKQRKLPGALRAFLEGFDHTAPRLALVMVNFAQIQNRPLHHAPTE